MGHINEGGNYLDPGNGMFAPAHEMRRGHHTGNIKTPISPSEAGRGIQKPRVPQPTYRTTPDPKHEDMHDG